MALSVPLCTSSTAWDPRERRGTRPVAIAVQGEGGRADLLQVVRAVLANDRRAAVVLDLRAARHVLGPARDDRRRRLRIMGTDDSE